MARRFLCRRGTGYRCFLDSAACAGISSLASRSAHGSRITPAALAQRYPQKWPDRHDDERSNFVRVLGAFYLDSCLSLLASFPGRARTGSDADGRLADHNEHRQILWVRAFRISWGWVGPPQKLHWISADGRILGAHLWIYKERNVVAYSGAVCRIFRKRLFLWLRSQRLGIISHGDSRDGHGDQL